MLFSNKLYQNTVCLFSLFLPFQFRFSRFPPKKKFYNIDYWWLVMEINDDFKCLTIGDAIGCPNYNEALLNTMMPFIKRTTLKYQK